MDIRAIGDSHFEPKDYVFRATVTMPRLPCLP